MQSDIFQNCLYGFCQEGQTINDKVMSFSLPSVHFHIKCLKIEKRGIWGRNCREYLIAFAAEGNDALPQDEPLTSIWVLTGMHKCVFLWKHEFPARDVRGVFMHTCAVWLILRNRTRGARRRWTAAASICSLAKYYFSILAVQPVIVLIPWSRLLIFVVLLRVILLLFYILSEFCSLMTAVLVLQKIFWES